MEGDLESARTAVEQYRHQVVETSQLEGEVSCLKMALLEKESLVKSLTELAQRQEQVSE